MRILNLTKRPVRILTGEGVEGDDLGYFISGPVLWGEITLGLFLPEPLSARVDQVSKGVVSTSDNLNIPLSICGTVFLPPPQPDTAYILTAEKIGRAHV